MDLFTVLESLYDFQKESAQKSTSTAIDVFYPIGFRTETEIEPTKDTLKLCVVGAMEYKKKDIAFLLEQIDWLEETGIELVIAGKIDPTKEDLLPLLNAVSNRKNITYSTTFIPDQELFKLIQQSHIVWPLIHPGEQKGNQYMTTQTSGSINMAFGFKKPLLLHKEFVRGDLLEESSITYTRRTFRETLEGLRDFDIIDKLDIRIKENKSFELSTYFKNL